MARPLNQSLGLDWRDVAIRQDPIKKVQVGDDAFTIRVDFRLSC